MSMLLSALSVIILSDSLPKLIASTANTNEAAPTATVKTKLTKASALRLTGVPEKKNLNSQAVKHPRAKANTRAAMRKTNLDESTGFGAGGRCGGELFDLSCITFLVQTSLAH